MDPWIHGSAAGAAARPAAACIYYVIVGGRKADPWIHIFYFEPYFLL